MAEVSWRSFGEGLLGAEVSGLSRLKRLGFAWCKEGSFTCTEYLGKGKRANYHFVSSLPMIDFESQGLLEPLHAGTPNIDASSGSSRTPQQGQNTFIEWDSLTSSAHLSSKLVRAFLPRWNS